MITLPRVPRMASRKRPSSSRSSTGEIFRRRLKVVPHHQHANLAQRVGEQVKLVLLRAEVLPVERLAGAVEHVFGGADIAEVEPQRAIQPAGFIQPAEKAARQSCLAHSAQTLHQDAGRVAAAARAPSRGWGRRGR